MSWVITDTAGEEQEILEGEGVLVLAQNQPCAQDWMLRQGLPPCGRQFRVMPSLHALEGYRPETIIVLSCYNEGLSLYQHQIRNVVTRNVAKARRGVRFIEVPCR